MNVYDFDNTLLRGDSTARFFAYCMRHYPKMWLDIPGQAVNGLLFILKLRPKQAFKQRMLGFLKYIDDVDAAVANFWKQNYCRIKSFYDHARREGDVVISASPEFLIRPACERLGIRHIMGSPVDKHTGAFFGPNCHGEEKLRRFYAAFPDGRIQDFYSDSHSDDPLANIAQSAVLVKGNRLLPWN